MSLEVWMERDEEGYKKSVTEKGNACLEMISIYFAFGLKITSTMSVFLLYNALANF